MLGLVMVGDSTVERMAVELLAVVRKKERVFLWVRRWERGCEGSSFACLGGNAPEWAFWYRVVVERKEMEEDEVCWVVFSPLGFFFLWWQIGRAHV